MTEAAPWLPGGTLRSERAAGPFVRAVGDWSQAWFGGAGWTAARSFARTAAPDWPLLREGADGGLRGRPKAMLDLAFALLGIKPRADLGEADLRLLRRVAGKALDDLQQRIDLVTPAGPARTGDGSPRWSLTIGPATGPVLQLDLAEPALIAAARKTFRPAARPAPLTPREMAWRELAVGCAAHLGRSGLAVRQIAALERGDIIVLDQAVDQPVRLALAGKTSELHFMIGDDGDRTTLTLQD